jgi:DHA1 family tetracycline resistance protein-like MFS transporter
MSFLSRFSRRTDTADAPAPRSAATVFIFVTIVLDVMAMGVTIPVLPRLIQTLGGGGAGRVAQAFGVFAAVFAVMQFLAQPIQGALSDRFGRRPIILASNFGLGADYLVMALAPTLPWLFLGRVISGAAAGSITAASAYMADISPPDQRAGGFGKIYGAMSVGIVAGPALGGLLSNIDLRAPFWAAAALSLLNAVYGVFVLPESLKAANRAPVVLSQLNPVGSLLHLVRSYPAMLGMVAVVLITGLTWQGVNVLWVVYTTFRYGWTPGDIALLLAVLGGVNFVVQTRLIAVLVDRFGDRAVALAGMVLTTVSMAIFGLARTGVEFWLAVPFMCLGNIGGPAWQALASNRVGPSEQGRLAGAFNGMFAIAGMVAPIAFTALFAFAVGGGRKGFWMGSPFFVGAGLLVAGLGLAVWATRTSGSEVHIAPAGDP